MQTELFSIAAEKYLSPTQIDGIALLAPPPETDSPEQAADFALSRNGSRNVRSTLLKVVAQR